jgi:CheY-like chemotaxis protein
MDALEHLFRLRVGGITMMGIRRNETNQVEEVSGPSTQNWAGKAMPIAGLAFLVAEDHETQRSILVRILKDLGAKHIHEAADGHGALSVIADPTRSVDIVISDLDMPGMDGMQFIRELGKVGARISIILASALERKLLGSVALMTEAYGRRSRIASLARDSHCKRSSQDYTTTNSSPSCNPRSHWRPGRSKAAKHSRDGVIRCTASSRPMHSSNPSKTTASSMNSLGSC